MTVTFFPDPQAAAFQLTREREGGDKPAGTLGDANHAFHGVNQSVYDRFRRRWGLNHQDVALMDAHEEQVIYEDYWTRAQCGPIAARAGSLAICHFDAFFNGGGVVILERTIGETADQIDDVLTEAEVDALIALVDAEGGEAGACAAYLQNRLDRFRALGNAAAEPGWEIRLDRVAAFIGISWRVS